MVAVGVGRMGVPYLEKSFYLTKFLEEESLVSGNWEFFCLWRTPLALLDE